MSVYKAGKNRRLEIDTSRLCNIKWNLRDYNTYFRNTSRGNYLFTKKLDLVTYTKKEVKNTREEQRLIVGKILGVLPMNYIYSGPYPSRDCNLVPLTESYWFDDVEEWYTDEELDLADDGKIFLPEHPECPYYCGIPKRIFGFI